MLDSFHLTPVSTRDVRNFISVCTLALQFIVCIDSQCFQSCLFLPHQCQLPEPSSAAPVCATSIESPPLGHHLTMATEYHAFFYVFCPQQATQLQPHLSWDCAIELLPGAHLPHCTLCPCQSRKPWRSTLANLSTRVTFAPLLVQLH